MTDVLSPAPSPVQLRAMLEAMVVGDLLGPVGGPDEELTERNVRDRYLVGVLAPRSVERGAWSVKRKAVPHAPRSTHLDPGTQLEDDTMAMLYRRRAEFAVAHGVSVHAELSDAAMDRRSPEERQGKRHESK